MALHPSEDGQPLGRPWRRPDMVPDQPGLARQSPSAPLHFLAEPAVSEA